MRSNKDVMRDRKASAFASTWEAAGGDSVTLRHYVELAHRAVGQMDYDPAETKAAQAVLRTIMHAASILRGKSTFWNEASLTTWSLAVRKLQLQELAS